MSKIVYFIIACIVILTAVTVIGITGVNASGDTKFVPVSVLAKDEANYGVDDHPLTIPPVSSEIIKDAARDMGSDLVTTIPYKILPPKNTGTAGDDNNGAQSENSAEVHNGYGNDGSSASNQNQNNGQNQNNNQNQNSNQNNKGKDKNKDKGNNGGDNNGKDKGNNGGGDNGKVNEKSSGSSNDNGNGNGNNK